VGIVGVVGSPPVSIPSIPEAVREACADVAARARSVRIVDEAVEARAESLAAEAEAPIWLGARAWGDDREVVAARVVVGNAVNFGSGWHPVLRKPPGLSGARTVAAALDATPLTAGDLATIDPGAVAELLGQDPAGPAAELLGLFAAALREVGGYVADRHDGSFAALVDAAGGSAVQLVGTLAGLPRWRDVCTYDGRPVPLWKRAQITANDLHRALGCFPDDVDRLTMFADNLIPHVLRLDGVLDVDDALVARVDRGELLGYGEPAEVELRAAAVHAVELLAAASGRPPRVLDDLLWTAGQEPRYKSVPRPRCRTTAY
jgi:putative queuosine salvage protein